MAMQFVRAAAPVAPWQGGKRFLSKTLIDRIVRIPHKTYVEPFVGMGGVFLRRPCRPRLEVANDRNGDIVNLFRVIQRHLPQLMDVMRFQLAGRREFERLSATDPTTLTDLERAARFLYLQRLAFGGHVQGIFGVSPTTASRFSLARLEPLLEAAHERLDGVVFECLDWVEIIRRYDTPQTLFYLDPPYSGSEDDYGKGLFAPEEFPKMADQLSRITGRFLLSINDTPAMRKTFGAFIIDEARVTYTITRGKSKTKAHELIVSNHTSPPGLL